MPWAPDYASAVDLQTFLRVGDTGDNADYARWVTTSSRMVDQHCKRQFGQVATAVTRTYRRPPVWSARLQMWLVSIDDVQDTTGMTVNGVALASSGAVLLPENAPADGVPYERLGFAAAPAAVTTPGTATTALAKWGWSAFPAGTIGATLLQASRLQSRRDSPYGTAGSPDVNGAAPVRLLARVDPDVAVALRGLTRLVAPW